MFDLYINIVFLSRFILSYCPNFKKSDTFFVLSYDQLLNQSKRIVIKLLNIQPIVIPYKKRLYTYTKMLPGHTSSQKVIFCAKQYLKNGVQIML